MSVNHGEGKWIAAVWQMTDVYGLAVVALVLDCLFLSLMTIGSCQILVCIKEC